MYDERLLTDGQIDGSKATDDSTVGEMGNPLKGKQREGIPSAGKAPLTLLDLPLDILKEIVQKVGTPSTFSQALHIKRSVGHTHQ